MLTMDTYRRGLLILEREARLLSPMQQLMAMTLNAAIAEAGHTGLSAAQEATVRAAAERF